MKLAGETPALRALVSSIRGNKLEIALKRFWWHRHLAGAVRRLEACATNALQVGQRPMRNCLVSPQSSTKLLVSL
jgi:hypothetical protein